MLDPSPRLKKEAVRIGCDANHIIMADLMLSGYTEAESYDIAYSENVSWAAQRKISHREKVLASDGYKRAYEERRFARKYISDGAEMRDKETVARDLNNLINQTTDAKLKAELLMKLADLQQMKKDATAVDEDPVRFFLPIDCDRCPLLSSYNEYLKKRSEESGRGTLEPLRADEIQMVIEMAYDDVERKRAVN